MGIFIPETITEIMLIFKTKGQLIYIYSRYELLVVRLGFIFLS